jgi:hypothetical protein
LRFSFLADFRASAMSFAAFFTSCCYAAMAASMSILGARGLF